ncbi:MAG: 2-phosphosulfolactate phosphatase [Planctomycetaceae bacterium]
MPAPIRIHLLPKLFEPTELAGGVAVIIDVLRASTTMIQALHSGVQRIIPCASVDEVEQRAAEFPRGERVLGGERHGLLIAGFDLDNSPRRYTSERVGGQTLVFTTTNGTLALRRSMAAMRIYVGAFVNREAIIDRLTDESRPIHLICAGTDGQMTAEDILFAGAVAGRLLQVHHESHTNLDIATHMAVEFADRHAATPEGILRTLRRSIGGRNLQQLGMEADVDYASRCDTLPVVPVWDAASQSLVASG